MLVLEGTRDLTHSRHRGATPGPLIRAAPPRKHQLRHLGTSIGTPAAPPPRQSCRVSLKDALQAQPCAAPKTWGRPLRGQLVRRAAASRSLPRSLAPRFPAAARTTPPPQRAGTMLHGPVREHGGEEEKQGAERGVARAGSSGSSTGSSVALQRTPGYRRRRGQASQRAPLPPKKHRSASDRRGGAYLRREEQEALSPPWSLDSAESSAKTNFLAVRALALASSVLWDPMF